MIVSRVEALTFPVGTKANWKGMSYNENHRS